MKYQYRFILIITILLAVIALAIISSARTALHRQTEANGLALAKSLASSVQFAKRVPERVDAIVGDQMVTQARIAAYLVAAAKASGMSESEVSGQLKEIVASTNLDEFWITDGSGKTVMTNVDQGLGFTFSPDPKEQPQAYEFYQLLEQKDGSIVQKAQERSIDGKVFKFVGVSGVDSPRIVQVSHEASFLSELEKDIDLHSLMNSMVDLEEVDAIVVDLGDGNIQTSSDGNLDSDETAGEAWTSLAAKAVERGQPLTDWSSGGLMVVTPLYNDTEQIQGTITLYMSAATTNTALRNMLLLAGGISIIGLLLGIGLASMIARDVTEPLQVLTRAASCLAQGDTALSKVDRAQIERVYTRKDEMGMAGKAFRELTAYLNEISLAAERLAKGDLTVQVVQRSEKDVLGLAFGRMTRSWSAMVGQIRASADRLGSAALILNENMEQTGAASTQITTTIEQISQGAAHQSQGASQTLDRVERMAQVIRGIAQGAQEQAGSVQQAEAVSTSISKTVQQMVASAQAQSEGLAKAGETTHAGVQVVQQAIQGMEKIRDKVQLSSSRMVEMGEHSEQIGAIVEAIEDIAAQTNLLALNAAIEAARAGEGGKGFAVVADEVRKLAERSSQATREVGTLVRTIQGSIQEAIDAMNESTREVESGVRYANQSGEALAAVQQVASQNSQYSAGITQAAQEIHGLAEKMAKAMTSVTRVVHENNNAVESLLSYSEAVTADVETIASVSEENSASYEEVSATTEEMSAQVGEVKAATESLARLAQELQSSVGQFQIEPVTAPAGQRTPRSESAAALMEA